MRKSLVSLAFLAACAGVAATAAAPVDRAETAYAALMDGKTAGTPQTCLDTRHYQASLSAWRDKLAYRVNRSLVYVNQTSGGCEGVSRGDILVTRSTQTSPCQGDIARTVDPSSGFTTGSCSLGAFVPYRAK